MLQIIKANSLLQLLILAVLITVFIFLLWTTGVTALFGGYSLEWWALSGNNGSFSKYLFFLIFPILSCIQSINMIQALMNGSWAKNFGNVPSFQIMLYKALYWYVALGFILIFVLSIRVYLTL